MLNLKRTLKDQRVFVALLNGIPVAKAGTNARGYGYDQIGGVFTRVKLRNRGIGTTVMQTLMKEIAKDGKKVCLFVKKTNPSALAMYANIGFKTVGEYRISYYR